jgi:hypothetical protein
MDRVLEDSTEVRGRVRMNRWRVREDRGSKEKDQCPLTEDVQLPPEVPTAL